MEQLVIDKVLTVDMRRYIGVMWFIGATYEESLRSSEIMDMILKDEEYSVGSMKM